MFDPVHFCTSAFSATVAVVDDVEAEPYIFHIAYGGQSGKTRGRTEIFRPSSNPSPCLDLMFKRNKK
jgi:hypothetical protein